MKETMTVNEKEYRVIRLLGKGKGGYSYLTEDESGSYVLKQIHHEPCSYYQFGNKMEAELGDYDRLLGIGITIPKLLDVDVKQERILKEYIEGDTIFDLIKEDRMREEYISQVKEMCSLLYAAHTNIDYFPTNFIPANGKLYYIDYECNDYMEEWNFENWGIRYWSKTPEFLAYLKQRMTIRELTQEEICTEVFSGFHRHQQVTKCWRKRNGSWVVIDNPFTEEWTDQDYEYLVKCLKHTVESGGAVFGTFEAEKLQGFVSVEPVLFGSRKQYLELSSLHVTEEMRGCGIGRRLIEQAKAWAGTHGAEKLYISAHSSVESQAFYRAVGCREAEEYSRIHVEKEPYDCQMELSV